MKINVDIFLKSHRLKSVMNIKYKLSWFQYIAPHLTLLNLERFVADMLSRGVPPNELKIEVEEAERMCTPR